VNTKADIRFDVLGADWLPDWVKENLLEQARKDAPWRCTAVCARRSLRRAAAAAGEEPHE
jgi:hypothetical protein